MTVVERAVHVAMVLGIGAAGCTKTAIRPDQLPIVTEAAARATAAPQEVIGASGEKVSVSGALDEVEITLQPGGVQTFRAPVASKVGRLPGDEASRGPMLLVNDEERSAALPMAWIQGVKVRHVNKSAELAGGVAMISVGGLAIAGGVVFSAAPLYSRNADTGIALAMGMPVLLTGIALVIPGILVTKSAAHRPKYPPRPVSGFTVVPDGIRVSF